MNTRIPVLMVFPEDIDLLQSDVAGRPCVDYFLEHLNASEEADARVITDSDSRSRPLFEKFKNIFECELAEFYFDNRAGQGLLVMDARASLSEVALADILARARGATHGFRIVESSSSIVAGHREAMTLAVYVPQQHLRRDLFARAHTGRGQGIEQILSRQAVADSDFETWPAADEAHNAMLVVSHVELAQLERQVLLGRAIEMMKQGVRLHDPATTYIRGNLVCAPGVEIDANVTIEGDVILGEAVKIGAHSILRNCRIGDKTSINPFSLVEQSSVGSNSFVGPYGRIRPGSVVGDNVQIGNYVEIKNSRVGDGSRINHHTFIGDATLDQNVTIGAGTITCNHDGFGAQQTIIERGAYIGSGCNLVAPLHIGENAIVGAGSTIASDVPAAKLTLARPRQTTIEDWQGPKTRRQRT
jgi:bifunctional UDP-N-acetylglucosamine pyrophosphorylase/glucosamine-1-phosphate N-acetyltransferase